MPHPYSHLRTGGMTVLYRDRTSSRSTVSVPIDSLSIRASKTFSRLTVIAPTASAPIAAAPNAIAPTDSAPTAVAPTFILPIARVVFIIASRSFFVTKPASYAFQNGEGPTSSTS